MVEETSKEEQEKKPKGGGMLSQLLIVAVVAGLAAAGAGVGVVMLMGGGKKSHSEEKAEAPKPVATVVTLDEFLVNLADPGGNRYLKAQIKIVVMDPVVAAAFKSDELVKGRVRDRIVTILSGKTYGDIGVPTGKEALRQELKKEINHVLPQDVVSEVLFTDFAVQ